MKWSNTSLVPLILLALVVSAWLWPVTIGGSRPIGGDISAVDLPEMTYYHQVLSQGRVPLWNEQIGFGRPILAQGQMGVLYPINLLLYGCLAPHDAYTVSMLAHLVLASWFAFVCARGFGLGPTASFLAAVVFVGQGFFVGHLGQRWSYQTGCWLPLAVYFGWRWLQDEDGRCLFGLILALAVQLLAGHFQLAFYTHVTLLAMAGLSLSGKKWWQGGRRACLLCAALVAAVVLAAVQLLPTTEYVLLADLRGRGNDYLSSFAVSAWHLVSYIAPTLLQRHPLWEDAIWAQHQTTGSAGLSYIGLIPLGLAVWSLGQRRRQRETWIFVILAGGSFILSWGPSLSVFRWLSDLPGFGWFAAPSRWSVVSGLFLGLLAGKGLEHLDQAWFPRFFRYYAVSIAGILAVYVLILVSNRESESFLRGSSDGIFDWKLLQYGYSGSDLATRRLTAASELPRMLFDELWAPVLHFVVLIGASWTVFRIVRPQTLTALMLAWSVVDLGIANQVLRRIDFEPRGDSARQSPVLTEVSEWAPHRIAGTIGSFPMLVGVSALGPPPFGDMQSYWKMGGRVFGDSAPTVPPLNRWGDLALMLGFRAGGVGEDELEFCRLSDIRVIVLESNALISLPENSFVHVRDIEDVWLRTHSVGADSLNPSAREWSIWEIGPETESARAWLFPLSDPVQAGTDPRLFVRPPPRRRGMLNGAIPVPDLVDRGESVEISGQTDGAAVLLLSDLYYPGWNAVLTQSGASVTVPIEPAFGHWRAVFIPQKGRFQICFQYQPESFAVGWQISMAMGILCVIGMAVVIMFHGSPQQADCAG